MKKKVRKPLNFTVGKRKIVSIESFYGRDDYVLFTYSDGCISTSFDLVNAQKLHKWLGKAIDYLESKEKK